MERPCASGSTSILSPVCVGHQASATVAGLIGCSRLVPLHTHINIHKLEFLYPVICATRVFCIAGSLSCVLLSPYVSEHLSVSLSLFLTYSLVQDPGGPTSFSTHACSNATYLVTPM